MQKKPEYSAFSKALLKFMNLYGFTQRDLAERLEISPSLVSDYSNGFKMPRMEKIDMLCRIFHCRRADLLDETAGELSADEETLLASFRVLDPDDRQVVLNMAALLAEKSKKTAGVG